MNKKIIIPIFAIIILAGVAFAAWNWNVSVIVNVSPGSCTDSDGGADYTVKGNASALVVVPNYYPPNTNTTLPVNAEDTCQGDILFEVVCGSSYGNAYSGLGGILSLNCSDLNTNNENYMCQAGACVNLNATLPPVNNTLPTGWTLYDDFSSGSLNNQLWSEAQDPEGQQFMGIHFVNLTSNNYEVENIGTQDQRIVLNLDNHTFVAGEKLEFDLNYISGSGNRAMVFFINGAPGDRLVATIGCSGPCSGGSIGTNGGAFLGTGNMLGTYHIKFEFKTNGINFTAIKPDTTIHNELIPIGTWNYAGNLYSSASPWNVGFEVWSNGAIHSTYDNFIIYSNNSTPPPVNNTNSTLPLVALWHFDEGNGTITIDASGNGRFGILLNGTNWTTDSFNGNAVLFDSFDDKIISNDDVDLNNETEITAKIKRISNYNNPNGPFAQNYGIITRQQGSFYLGIDNQQLVGAIKLCGYQFPGCGTPNQNWVTIAGPQINIGNWYNLKLVKNKTYFELYLDNQLVNSISTINTEIGHATGDLSIGGGSFEPGSPYSYNTFSGIIDEVSIRGY